MIEKKDIVFSAISAFSSKGGDTTIADISKAANVPESTIYNKYGSKEDILIEIHSFFWDQLLMEIKSVTDSPLEWGQNEIQQLRTLTTLIQHFLLRDLNLNLAKIVSKTSLRPPEQIDNENIREKRVEVRKKNREALHIIDEIIRNGQINNKIIKSLKPQVIRQILIGSFQTLLYGLIQFTEEEEAFYPPYEALKGINHVLNSITNASKKEGAKS